MSPQNNAPQLAQLLELGAKLARATFDATDDVAAYPSEALIAAHSSPTQEEKLEARRLAGEMLSMVEGSDNG